MSEPGYRTPRGLAIPAHAVRLSFARSGGPGGQHVNTSSTKVRVAIDLEHCGFDERRAARLVERLGPTVRASSERYRSQARNREAAIGRALDRIDEALTDRPVRRPTKPSAGAKARRRQDKARRSQQKAARRPPEVE